MNPLVSIIIPTYNRSHLIEETLHSVLAQTYTNWECIIVDDGSVDDTINVINKFIKHENRFTLIERPTDYKKGASVCRNIGIEKSKGTYIQFLDSDDLFLSNKISDQIILVNNSEENTIVTCKWGRFTNNISDSIIYDSLKSYGYFDDMLKFLDALAFSQGGYFPIHAYLIKKTIITKVGLWNEYLTINDDTEFMMRVIANTDKIYFSNDSIAFYRYPINNNLSSHNNLQRVNDALKGWALIDAYLKVRFKKDSILYIELMKNLLYANVKNSFPELIKKHSLFFKSQIKADPYVLFIFNRIKNKIKKIVKALF